MSLGRHEKPIKGGTDTWITPIDIIQDLGPFDMDVCCPESMPWPTARKMITESMCGLATEWKGFVWMNPPYSKNKDFSVKFKNHRNGIALVFARTETEWFSNFYDADIFFFIKGRLSFFNIDGVKASGNAGAPSVLVGYGLDAVNSIVRFSNKRNGLLLRGGLSE